MKNLNTDWFTEGLLDFEYKQYVLLAYLQEVESEFGATRLYPALSELIEHCRNLIAYQESKNELKSKFPKKLLGFNHEAKLQYQTQIPPDEIVEQIDQIVDFALPLMNSRVNDGIGIYEWIESKINLFPVGLMPLYKDEGYLFIRIADDNDIQVFRYKTGLFHKGDEQYRSLYTQYIRSYTYGLTQVYENMKLQLINTYKELPNPATFALECHWAMPIEATLLPVARRSLLRAIVA